MTDLTIYVETCEGAFSDWICREEFSTPKEAWGYVAEMTTTSEGEQTTFGLDGVRVIDDAGDGYYGPYDYGPAYEKIDLSQF